MCLCYRQCLNEPPREIERQEETFEQPLSADALRGGFSMFSNTFGGQEREDGDDPRLGGGSFPFGGVGGGGEALEVTCCCYYFWGGERGGR